MTWCSRSPLQGERQGMNQKRRTREMFHEPLMQYVCRTLMPIVRFYRKTSNNVPKERRGMVYSSIFLS